MIFLLSVTKALSGNTTESQARIFKMIVLTLINWQAGIAAI